MFIELPVTQKDGSVVLTLFNADDLRTLMVENDVCYAVIGPSPLRQVPLACDQRAILSYLRANGILARSQWDLEKLKANGAKLQAPRQAPLDRTKNPTEPAGMLSELTNATRHSAGPGWQDRPATEPQIKAIYAIARGTKAMDDDTLEEWCRNRFGGVPAELSRRQASEAIDALKLGGM